MGEDAVGKSGSQSKKATVLLLRIEGVGGRGKMGIHALDRKVGERKHRTDALLGAKPRAMHSRFELQMHRKAKAVGKECFFLVARDGA